MGSPAGAAWLKLPSRARTPSDMGLPLVHKHLHRGPVYSARVFFIPQVMQISNGLSQMLTPNIPRYRNHARNPGSL
jgi:hypothetical protein